MKTQTVGAGSTIQSSSLRGGGVIDDRGDVDRLQRYESYVPVYGGIKQVEYGVKEMHNSHTFKQKTNGFIDASLGVTGTITPVGRAAIYLQALTPIVPAAILAVASPAVAIASVAGSIVDGGRDIYNAFHEHDKSDGVVGAVKLASGGMSAFGAMTGNLPLLIAGSVVYGGAVMVQNWDSVTKGCHNLKEKLFGGSAE